MKQIIIARKDLNMSPGKLAVQVSHASMAFLTSAIREKGERVLKWPIYKHPTFDPEHPGEPALYKRNDLTKWAREAFSNGEPYFFTRPINPAENPYNIELCAPEYEYSAKLTFNEEVFENWIVDSFAKIVCGAKNKYQLMKACVIADELGLSEGVDYFLIKDNCHTELTPEETGENGVGRTLTCIGFRPLQDEIAEKISRKYQLYK